MIVPQKRDPKLITVRRGGTLQDTDHHLLAVWAADCAEHVLHFFEEAQPLDNRPRQAIELARAWARGEITMTQARSDANAAASDVEGAAREAAHAAEQAAAVAHVAAHELGASAYAIRAVRAAAPNEKRDEAGQLEYY